MPVTNAHHSSQIWRPDDVPTNSKDDSPTPDPRVKADLNTFLLQVMQAGADIQRSTQCDGSYAERHRQMMDKVLQFASVLQPLLRSTT